MKNIFLKFINWIFNREKKVDKQKNCSITIINGDINITNIKVDDDKKEQS